MEIDSSAARVSQPPEAAPARTLGTDIRIWVRDILISLSIAAVVIVFLCQPVKVEGTSMLPQLAHDQRIFVNKFLYRIDSVERGDVIVFKFPEDPSRSYIKRVVGLPGDTVEIRTGGVHINGEAYREPHVPQAYRDRASHPAVTVPAGEYYVLGDHRNTSNDSRTWGTVAETFITGKAVFAYWPPDRFGVVR